MTPPSRAPRRTVLSRTRCILLPCPAIMVVGLGIITFVPDLVLWLPRLYGYGG
ncbi:hypothetical protein HKCCSP123_12410 [Rhodobacterales bacterium HKCCSP123]|nr:hypothetical protein [Rhodobacterales bacterium HKCCSP123]